jgi:hypothetical protein
MSSLTARIEKQSLNRGLFLPSAIIQRTFFNLPVQPKRKQALPEGNLSAIRLRRRFRDVIAVSSHLFFFFGKSEPAWLRKLN